MQDGRGKYLVKNTLIFTLGNMGTKIISFLLVPLYTKSLSTNDYGIIDLITSICLFIVPIITFNIGEAIMRYSLDRDADNNKIMSIGNMFIIICVLLATMIFPISYLFPDLDEYSLHIFLYVISLGMCQIYNCNLRGKEKLLEYAISNIIHSFTIAGFNIIFILVFNWGIKGYFVSYILSNFCTAIYAFIMGDVKKTFKTFFIDRNLLIHMAKYSCILIPNSFMWWIINSSDRIMVTNMIGAEANGIYAISYKIPTLLSTFSIIFNQAWSYSAIKEVESTDNVSYSNFVYSKIADALYVITAALLLVIKPFIYIYVDERYYSAWKYTPYLLIGFLFMTLATFLSTSYTVNKDSKGFLISASIGATLNILFNFALIPTMGISGAALSTCITYISIFVFRAIHTRKYLIINIFRLKHALCFALVCIMGITNYSNSFFGKILLVFEFILILLILREFIYEILKFMNNFIINKLRIGRTN